MSDDVLDPATLMKMAEVIPSKTIFSVKDEVYDKARKVTEAFVDESLAKMGVTAFYDQFELEAGATVREGPESEWRDRTIDLMVALSLESFARQGFQ